MQTDADKSTNTRHGVRQTSRLSLSHSWPKCLITSELPFFIADRVCCTRGVRRCPGSSQSLHVHCDTFALPAVTTTKMTGLAGETDWKLCTQSSRDMFDFPRSLVVMRLLLKKMIIGKQGQEEKGAAAIFKSWFTAISDGFSKKKKNHRLVYSWFTNCFDSKTRASISVGGRTMVYEQGTNSSLSSASN